MFWIHSAVLCALFALLVVPSVRRNPLRWLHDYPAPIRERVASLERYRGRVISHRRGPAKTAAALLLGATALAALAWLGGQKTFLSAAAHAYGLWAAVVVFDTAVLDILWFCRSKSVRIPGTEDLEAAYRDWGFHIRAGLRGLMFGLLPAALAGLLVSGAAALAGGAV